MPKILVFSNQSDDFINIVNPLKEIGYIVEYLSDESKIFETISAFVPDIMLLCSYTAIKDIAFALRKIRLQDEGGDIQIILLVNKDAEIDEVFSGADGYVTRPINPNILVATVNAHLRLKNHLDIFSANNSELAKRFYQLKVLYDTNSNLAGTLNKRRLINIMNEGLEQSISYSLCSTLVMDNPDDISLIINSHYPITKRLEQALKLRAMIAYKSMFKNESLPFEINIEKVRTEVNFKQENGKYDLEVMSYGSVFSPISTSDKFFGTVEIMRDTELSNEDITCFQTVVSQVALPLESAILYEEIQDKNVKLEKLEKLKSEFVSIVSHELRTPLTAIKNSIDIMLSGKSGELTDGMKNFLSMGDRNVVRLSGIINDLLDLSKIEAGKMQYRFEEINLVNPINFVISTLKSTAEAKNITFGAKINIDEARVYADMQKVEQILTNLTSNAIKFTGKDGSVSITLDKIQAKNLDISKFYEYNKEPLAENYFLVQVQDTGIGIAKENMTKVFDKFQQIESSLSRKVGGTGLGLPIAKEFINAHKGFVWAESEESKGSVFSFVLPEYSTKVKGFNTDEKNVNMLVGNDDFGEENE
ncbi:MAG: hybrid sensor histidine kinase/response regulator [Candidatus Gastranaerophilales bacterium]|nr:hybrid sensor histidine kinase/response regulator [Candidatus Gastranaerophilales bacterium]